MTEKGLARAVTLQLGFGLEQVNRRQTPTYRDGSGDVEGRGLQELSRGGRSSVQELLDSDECVERDQVWSLLVFAKVY